MSENNTAQRWISDLLFNAIVGALAGMLINLLGSLFAPEYWGAGNWWGMAGWGAAGAVGAMLYTRFRSKASRNPENSN